MQQTTETTVIRFSDDNNDTFAGSQSVEQHEERFLANVIFYVALALGIPGNILSAIVWLRRNVVSENPSAIYLAALAITDLVYLILDLALRLKCYRNDGWLCRCLTCATWSGDVLDLFLVLSFSVVRLLAIRRPLQANLLFTEARTKKVIIGLVLVAVIVGCTLDGSYRHMHSHYIMYVIFIVLNFAFYMVVPVTVLIINAVLIREVRRAANNAAANLGLQQHHQSTSSNSAVPTVMLITTSLVYVLLSGTQSILDLTFLWTSSLFLEHYYVIAQALSYLVFAYNFYVYLITGKRFRSELRTLFCRSSSSFSSSSSAAAATVATANNRNNGRLAGREQLAMTAVPSRTQYD